MENFDLKSLSDEDRAALVASLADQLGVDELKSEIKTLREEKAELKGRLDQATLGPPQQKEFDLHTQTEWGQAHYILNMEAEHEKMLNAQAVEEGRTPSTERQERLQRFINAYNGWQKESTNAEYAEKQSQADFDRLMADLKVEPESEDYRIARGAHLAGMTPQEIKAGYFDKLKAVEVDAATAQANAEEAQKQAQAAALPDGEARTTPPAEPAKPVTMSREEALAAITAKARERRRPATFAGLFGAEAPVAKEVSGT